MRQEGGHGCEGSPIFQMKREPFLEHESPLSCVPRRCPLGSGVNPTRLPSSSRPSSSTAVAACQVWALCPAQSSTLQAGEGLVQRTPSRSPLLGPTDPAPGQPEGDREAEGLRRRRRLGAEDPVSTRSAAARPHRGRHT